MQFFKYFVFYEKQALSVRKHENKNNLCANTSIS